MSQTPELQTILGTDIPIETRGIVYLCVFNGKSLKVKKELFFNCSFEALNAYANIPNPESQLVMGKTYDKLILELHSLHNRMNTSKFIEFLKETV